MMIATMIPNLSSGDMYHFPFLILLRCRASVPLPARCGSGYRCAVGGVYGRSFAHIPPDADHIEEDEAQDC